ncbi:MAG: T9SS type A sorting domain-containing protein [Bacteroidia bacterium]
MKNIYNKLLPVFICALCMFVNAGHAKNIDFKSGTQFYKITKYAGTQVEAEASGNDTICTTDSVTQWLSVCAGDSVTVGNNIYKSSGTYTDTLLTTSGCDSIVVTILTVNALPIVNVSGHTHHVCGSVDSLKAIVTGNGPFTYYWTNGSTTSSAGVILNTTYSVTVTDTNGCIAASSFRVHDSVPVVRVCMVTVDSTSTYNIIIWNNPGPNSGIDTLYLGRDSLSVPIAKLLPGAFSEFKDTTNAVNPNAHAYIYGIQSFDSCGEGSGALTGTATTIYLTLSPASPCGYNLNWTRYNGYFSFTEYYIYRDSANTGWKLFDSVPAGTLAWTDTICYTNGVSIAYVIEVVNPDPCNPATSRPEKMNNTTTRSNTQHNGIFTSTLAVAPTSNFISICPNPGNGVFRLRIKNYELGINNSIVVYNVLGEKIYSIKNYHIAESSNHQIDISSQPAGMYFVKVTTNTSTQVVKFIKE